MGGSPSVKSRDHSAISGVASMAKPLFLRLMYLQGIEDRDATPKQEIYAYVDLLKREDGGREQLRETECW